MRGGITVSDSGPALLLDLPSEFLAPDLFPSVRIMIAAEQQASPVGNIGPPHDESSVNVQLVSTIYLNRI